MTTKLTENSVITTPKMPMKGITTSQLSFPELNKLCHAFGKDESAMLGSLLSRQVPFYVRLQVSPFEAQAARLLNALVTDGHSSWPKFNLFFCSSALEAISGALKIVRHNWMVRNSNTPPITAVFDPTKELKTAFDPLDQGVEAALVPGLCYFQTAADAIAAVQSRKVSSLLILQPAALGPEQVNQMIDLAKQQNVLTILDESSTDLMATELLCHSLTVPPDVITFGSNLTNRTVPSGCLMVSKAAYQVWNTFGNSNLHTNTWGGNSVSMNGMLDHLRSTNSYKKLTKSVRAKIDAVTSSHRLATRSYAKYNNAKLVSMMKLSNLNKNITSATRSRLTVTSRSTSIQVIDAAGTYGMNLRGHHPTDFRQAVLDNHNPNHDYWCDLENVFQQKTGLGNLLPAVSGATANDIAISMALMAAFPKRRIIAMEMGYHGKTLISLAATYKQRIRKPFAPLYPHVTFVNPFADDCEQTLTKLFESGDVALVTLETIQGEGGIRSLPQRLLDFLNTSQMKHDFFVSVDEVQSGMYRTGRFLNHQGKLASPDLIAMGKGMSDMVFPVAATVVSDRVFHAACNLNRDAVAQLVNLYRCQFGAHTALHAIESADAMMLADRARELGDYFRTGLQQIAANSSRVKEIRGEGLMLGIELDPKSLPKALRGSFGGLMASQLTNDSEAPVLAAFAPDKPQLIRFLPPLTITKPEIDVILDTTKRCLESSLWNLVSPLVANVINPKVWLPEF